METITELYAFISPNLQTGQEEMMTMLNNATGKEREAIFPWKDVAQMAYPLIVEVMRKSGRSFKVLRFTLTDDITEEMRHEHYPS